MSTQLAMCPECKGECNRETGYFYDEPVMDAAQFGIGEGVVSFPTGETQTVWVPTGTEPCPRCKGTGSVNVSELNDLEFSKHLEQTEQKRVRNLEIQRDLQILHAYRGIPPVYLNLWEIYVRERALPKDYQEWIPKLLKEYDIALQEYNLADKQMKEALDKRKNKLDEEKKRLRLEMKVPPLSRWVKVLDLVSILSIPVCITAYFVLPRDTFIISLFCFLGPLFFLSVMFSDMLSTPHSEALKHLERSEASLETKVKSEFEDLVNAALKKYGQSNNRKGQIERYMGGFNSGSWQYMSKSIKL